MGLDHLAVMKTELGLGTLVHRRCLEACGAVEVEAEVTDEDLELAGLIIGCALCDESLES